MNIKNLVNMDAIVKDLEAVFEIDGQDYEEQKFSIIISNIKKRLNKKYNIDLTLGKSNDIIFENDVYRSSTYLFIESVARICATTSLLCLKFRYESTIPVSISSINYMGLLPEDLKGVLVALQKERTMASCELAIGDIERKLVSIRTCYEKRFFMILCVAYELGFYEVVACVAEILYLAHCYNS